MHHAVFTGPGRSHHGQVYPLPPPEWFGTKKNGIPPGIALAVLSTIYVRRVRGSRIRRIFNKAIQTTKRTHRRHRSPPSPYPNRRDRRCCRCLMMHEQRTRHHSRSETNIGNEHPIPPPPFPINNTTSFGKSQTGLHCQPHVVHTPHITTSLEGHNVSLSFASQGDRREREADPWGCWGCCAAFSSFLFTTCHRNQPPRHVTASVSTRLPAACALFFLPILTGNRARNVCF